MRIFNDMLEATKEVERDLWEMGINVHPETMQDKIIVSDEGYGTKEIRGYGFQIVRSGPEGIRPTKADQAIRYLMSNEAPEVLQYVEFEVMERLGDRQLNPGTSWKLRKNLWKEFLHDGKFAYTYSERFAPQLKRIMSELIVHPSTRQAIITMHSNISCSEVEDSKPEIGKDLSNIGGHGRIPCSMYYQLLIRDNKLDLIYTMRSCDFLVHFVVDIACALRILGWAAMKLNKDPGTFTYFVGSLHAYYKDMKERGIF